MIELQRHDLQYVLARLPKDVRDMISSNPGRLFLAGGFIRAVIAGEVANDIDLFGFQKQFVETQAECFQKTREGSRIHKTANAITVLSPEGRLPVQFITRWTFAEAEALANSFDFTVCKAVVWYSAEAGWKSICDDRFYADLAARRLHYTSPVCEEAGGSMMRAIKYIKRGYTIQPDSLGGVIARLADKVRPDGLQDTAKVITGLLREVDPLLVLDGLTVIDEVHAH